MKIKTDFPIIDSREKISHRVSKFWDQISESWKMIWGTHIHHGFYEEKELPTPLEAQEKLIDKLAELLKIKSDSVILDAGCGMGGSSFYLANKFQAKMTGISLSQKQIDIANEYILQKNIKHVSFKVEDALLLDSFADNSFDIVWSLESCEQFFDKEMFLKQTFRVLKPGGQLMLATWCSDREEYENKYANQYLKLCRAFDLPYMPTLNYYQKILARQNFAIISAFDWSSSVKKSWDVGISLVSTFHFFQLLKMAGWRGLWFARQIKMMRDAFQQNRVRYGVFLAEKPR